MYKDPPKSLFVTNLPYSLDLEDFKSYFTKFGPVERFDIPDHPAKPIAFVHFENSDDAARCLKENNGILYHGKILRIKYSSKAKPEHPPPLPASIRTDEDATNKVSTSVTDSSNTENKSYQKERETNRSPPDKHLHIHKMHHDDFRDNWESRRRDPSPNYEVERRRNPYSKHDYIDKTRERIQYRDRIDRVPHIDRERDRDYYNDYYRDYDNYPYHRHGGSYREREPVRDFHERDFRGSRDRDRDYYDYQYPPSSHPPIPQSPQKSQQQIPRNIPYPVSQNSPILAQPISSTAPIQTMPQQQINDLVRVPRSTLVRSQIPGSAQMQVPSRLQEQAPSPSTRGPPSSSIQQSQQHHYEYDGNRYYNQYRQ